MCINIFFFTQKNIVCRESCKYIKLFGRKTNTFYHRSTYNVHMYELQINGLKWSFRAERGSKRNRGFQNLTVQTAFAPLPAANTPWQYFLPIYYYYYYFFFCYSVVTNENRPSYRVRAFRLLYNNITGNVLHYYAYRTFPDSLKNVSLVFYLNFTPCVPVLCNAKIQWWCRGH